MPPKGKKKGAASAATAAPAAAVAEPAATQEKKQVEETPIVADEPKLEEKSNAEVPKKEEAPVAAVEEEKKEPAVAAEESNKEEETAAAAAAASEEPAKKDDDAATKTKEQEQEQQQQEEVAKPAASSGGGGWGSWGGWGLSSLSTAMHKVGNAALTVSSVVGDVVVDTVGQTVHTLVAHPHEEEGGEAKEAKPHEEGTEQAGEKKPEEEGGAAGEAKHPLSTTVEFKEELASVRLLKAGISLFGASTEYVGHAFQKGTQHLEENHDKLWNLATTSISSTKHAVQTAKEASGKLAEHVGTVAEHVTTVASSLIPEEEKELVYPCLEMGGKLALDLTDTVILRRKNCSHEEDPFFQPDLLQTPAVPGSFEAIARLSRERFVNSIYIVCCATPPMQAKFRRWLAHTKFLESCGIPRENVHFVREEGEKADLVGELDISHFVDSDEQNDEVLKAVLPADAIFHVSGHAFLEKKAALGDQSDEEEEQEEKKEEKDGEETEKKKKNKAGVANPWSEVVHALLPIAPYYAEGKNDEGEAEGEKKQEQQQQQAEKAE